MSGVFQPEVAAFLGAVCASLIGALVIVFASVRIQERAKRLSRSKVCHT